MLKAVYLPDVVFKNEIPVFVLNAETGDFIGESGGEEVSIDYHIVLNDPDWVVMSHLNDGVVYQLKKATAPNEDLVKNLLISNE